MVSVDVIDLFSGPGGLGEGFSSWEDGNRFKIRATVEMNSQAHATLSLREFYRFALYNGDSAAMRAYRNYCSAPGNPHPRDAFPGIWQNLQKTTLNCELGTIEGNNQVDSLIESRKLKKRPVVIIGGPPCQAYSLVGRSRNKGVEGYLAENDRRHFLYKEYLRIIARVRPMAFILENVKGLLSSEVGGERIFDHILEDLTNPSLSRRRDADCEYELHALTVPAQSRPGASGEHRSDPSHFVVRCENYGIPQARHRVIILGVRKDLKLNVSSTLERSDTVTIEDAFAGLPKLRSRLSHMDSPKAWKRAIADGIESVVHDTRVKGDKALSDALRKGLLHVRTDLPSGALRMSDWIDLNPPGRLDPWYRRGEPMEVYLNHESRAHMPSDLSRYFYAAVFAEVHDRSPAGPEDFCYTALSPDHKNWNTGKFKDRFRVQVYGEPSRTVTSHISKDGHYYIHPDPSQCRSLTVREAARLQTFPDNYFFEGNRTEQFHQVGNAVPPLLAYQIAGIVSTILK